MSRLVRTLAVAGFAVAFLAACSLPLPEPIELEGGIFGLDGVEVDLAAIAPASIAPLASSSFSGTINESYTVSEGDIPSVLQNLFTVASVDEEIGLGVSLSATSVEVLPASFVVSAASLTEVEVTKGAQTVFSGDFSTVAGGEMTFDLVSCAGDTCSYTASATSALVDVSLSGNTADQLAKAIVAGGTFNVSANFTVNVAPALPDDTAIVAVLVSLGAVLE
jgi:hypothetical protein